MSPKKANPNKSAKNKLKASGRGTAKALAPVNQNAESLRSAPVRVLGGYNSDIVLKAQQTLDEILQVETFALGAQLPADEIKVVEEGGGESCSYIPPFELPTCTIALKYNGKYDCGFNILKLKKLVLSTSRGVPVRQDSIDAFERFHLAGDPRTLTLEHKLWCRVDTSVDIKGPTQSL